MSNSMSMNVLSLKRWSMTDDNTGEVRVGCTVFVGQDTENTLGDVLGWDVLKFSAPISVFERAKIQKQVFPAICLVQVAFKMGAGGKGTLSILSIESSD